MSRYQFTICGMPVFVSRWKPWFFWHVMRRIGLAKDVSDGPIKAVQYQRGVIIYSINQAAHNPPRSSKPVKEIRFRLQ